MAGASEFLSDSEIESILEVEMEYQEYCDSFMDDPGTKNRSIIANSTTTFQCNDMYSCV